MRGCTETTMTAVSSSSQRMPSPPTMTPSRRPTSIRVKRGMLRRMKTFPSTDLASDTTSSPALSARSGQMETASHDRSSECSGPAAQATPGLLTRRRRSETPAHRIHDVDQLSTEDVDNNCNVLAEQHQVEQRLDNQDGPWINDRLPLIHPQRPLSRHVVYSMQYEDKMTTGDGAKSLFDRRGSNIAGSLLDWPHTDQFDTHTALAMQRRWSASSPVSLHIYRDPPHIDPPHREPPPKAVSRSRFLLNDQFLDRSTKTRILSWLQSVEVALVEDSVDAKTLSAIKEEESLNGAQSVITGMNKSV